MKVLVLGVIVLKEIQFVELETLVEAWIVFALLAVLIMVNRNCPFASRMALVSSAAATDALATLTTPVIPAAAWPNCVHS